MSESELPRWFSDFLLNAGIPKKAVEESTLQTRLYHDLGLYGDTAWWFVEDVAKEVDMSQFCFERYFPSECYGESHFTRMIYWLCPFVGAARRKRETYEPLTLQVVLESLESGKWADPFSDPHTAS